MPLRNWKKKKERGLGGIDVAESLTPPPQIITVSGSVSCDHCHNQTSGYCSRCARNCRPEGYSWGYRMKYPDPTAHWYSP